MPLLFPKTVQLRRLTLNYLRFLVKPTISFFSI